MEYSSAFAAVSAKGHSVPDQRILEVYWKFKKWCDEYTKNPEIGENPYKDYNYGFKKK